MIMLRIFKQASAPDQQTVAAVLTLRDQIRATLAYLEEIGSFRREKTGWHDCWLATREVRVLLRAVCVPSYRLDGEVENELQLLCDYAGGVIRLENANAEVIGFNLRTHMSTHEGLPRFTLVGTVVDPARVHTGYIAHDASNNGILMMSGVRTIAGLFERFEPRPLPVHGLQFML